jgi:transposase
MISFYPLYPLYPYTSPTLQSSPKHLQTFLPQAPTQLHTLNMAQATKEHIRHSLLFLFDAIQCKQILASNEAKTALEWIEKVYGSGVISESSIKNWFREFRSGNRSLEDKQRSGRPTEIDVVQLEQLMDKDDKLTSGELAEALGCSDTQVRFHLHSLGRTWVLGRWCHKELSPEKKQARVEICTKLLEQYENGQLSLDDIVAEDETWVLYNNVVRPHHWSKKGESPAPTPKAGAYPKKSQMVVWWSARGVLYWDLVPKGVSINKELYCEKLEEVNKSLRHGPLREQHNYKKVYRMLHDNARCHTANMTKEKLRELKMEPLDHPAESPDLSPTDFAFNRPLKNFLRGKKYESEEEVRAAIKDWITSRPPQFFREGIEELPDRWREVIASGGECILD